MGYTFESLNSNYTNDLSYLTGLTNKLTIIVDRPTDAVSSDLTIPSNVQLRFVDSGMVNIESGKTVTFTSPSNIIAPASMKIKTGSGTIEFSGTGGGGVAHLKWWGDDHDALQEAIDALGHGGGGIVKIPQITINVPYTVGIAGTSNVSLKGIGEGSVLNGLRSGTPSRDEHVLELNGLQNVSIEGIKFNDGNASQKGQVVITGTSSNITIKDCKFTGGYAGVWCNPETDNTIENIMIFDNHVGCVHPIYLGSIEDRSGDVIKNVKVIGNYCSSQNGTTNSDGIKLLKSTSDVIIQNNVFSGNQGDGIDMFASGDRITVIGNIVENNTIQGIDLKTDEVNYPPETWGKNKQVVIKGNIIRNNNVHGVKIYAGGTKNSGGSILDEWPYLIDVVDNQIYNNTHSGVFVSGRHINVAGNSIFENCQIQTSAAQAAIHIEGGSNEYIGSNLLTEYITIQNNQVVNNGNNDTARSTFGIWVKQFVEHAKIFGNTVINDSNMPNSGQQNYGIHVNSITNSDILLKNNRCEGYIAGVNYVTIANGDKSQGETVTCKIGSIAQGTTDERPIFTAPSNLLLASAKIINSSTVATGSNYMELSIINKGADGTGTGAAFKIETNTAGVELTAFESISMGSSLGDQEEFLSKGDTITLKKENGASGDGASLDEAFVILNYITY